MPLKLKIFLFLCNAATFCSAQQHPNLILTKAGIELIRNSEEIAPLFSEVLKVTKKEVDAEIKAGIFVPVPKDMAGGYTHERHKKNFFILQKAGNLYQITGEEKYATYIRDMFLEYAVLFPKLGLHPTMKSYATGKIFWQCLNDANWLVYSSQAYDAIYDFLTKKEREKLETNLFRPLADFISIKNPKFYNRIHNHSTWGNAAVGMIGLVMNDEELIQRALYGIKNDGLDDSMLDNDGGFIKGEAQNKAGFLAQLDYSFSPDGYFSEGPYYLRYAMTPFLLFAKSLHNNRPGLKIYDYRDGILKKAVFSLLAQTDANGLFFPLNDSQKGMSWNAREVIAAVDIAYVDFGKDPELLSIVKKQNKVLLDGSGFIVARDIAAGKAKNLVQKSVVYRDGAEGEKGGVAILRENNADGDEICAVIKYSAQGMGHGHFDKLSYSLYDDTGEVVQDYGAARWVNIDQKGGGRYLKENKTFAKQSIAHNTLVVNEESHYGGSVKKGEANSPDLYFVDIENRDCQILSAKEQHAYDGTEMHRTLILLQDENFRNPLFLDIFRVKAEKVNQYDLPLWFMGHLLSTDFEYQAETTRLKTLGADNGYQHLWREATGKSADESLQMTWFGNGKFYTETAAAQKEDELIFARGGANDPEFNLRHDPVFIQRRQAKSTVFFNVIESHGRYDTVSEIPLSPFSDIAKAEVLHDTDAYTVTRLTHNKGKTWIVALSNNNTDKTAEHEVKVGDQIIKWKGVYHLFKK